MKTAGSSSFLENTTKLIWYDTTLTVKFLTFIFNQYFQSPEVHTLSRKQQHKQFCFISFLFRVSYTLQLSQPGCFYPVHWIKKASYNWCSNQDVLAYKKWPREPGTAKCLPTYIILWGSVESMSIEQTSQTVCAAIAAAPWCIWTWTCKEGLKRKEGISILSSRNNRGKSISLERSAGLKERILWRITWNLIVLHLLCYCPWELALLTE